MLLKQYTVLCSFTCQVLATLIRIVFSILPFDILIHASLLGSEQNLIKNKLDEQNLMPTLPQKLVNTSLNKQHKITTQNIRFL